MCTKPGPSSHPFTPFSHDYICDVQTQVLLTGLFLSVSKDLWLKLVCNGHLFFEGRLLILQCLAKLHFI